MKFEINFKSGLPAYIQIMDQVKTAVAARTLQPGEQLPSIRELAEQLRVNRNTISKAYNELEHDGVVESRPGRGVFIADVGDSPLRKSAREQIVTEALDAAWVQARHLNISETEFLELAKNCIETFEKRRK